MQSLNWYLRRTQAMTAREVAWRAFCVARDAVDRCLVPARAATPRLGRLGENGTDPWVAGFRVTDVAAGAWSSSNAPERSWREHLVRRADSVAAHRLSFFDLHEHYLGHPIQWNRDPQSGRAAPLMFAPAIDYRDYDVAGDCKYVWELNRHHHLVVLGRAYRASGDPRYAAAVIEQLGSWLDACPFAMGMNWRSPLELAVRLINWVWAIDLIRDANLFDAALKERILRSVFRQVWEITRKYSRGSSVNNHLIGEGAGVFIATSYFRGLRRAARWKAESREILCEQILAQTYPDGVTREQALGYHLFVLQFFLLAGIVARRTATELPDDYWSRLAKMLEFLSALVAGGESLPMFGDADDGYVLDLGAGPPAARALLSIGACLLARADLQPNGDLCAAAARRLPGTGGFAAQRSVADPANGSRLSSRAFPDAGYYLLQAGHQGSADGISVLFDCGELGYGRLAAHGHADALSVAVRVCGHDVLVDPGTYDYFTDPRWREYFRSTRAHNTIVVDGADQSEMLGPFLWGARAGARRVAWEPTEDGGRVVGEHDGYARLPDPVRHRRAVELDGRARVVTIRDELEARQGHEIAVYFQVAENCRVARGPNNEFTIHVGPGAVRLILDGRLTVQTLSGSADPIGGWVSRGYHQKAPSATLVGRCRTQGMATFISQLRLGSTREGLSCDAEPGSGDAPYRPDGSATSRGGRGRIIG